MLTVRKITNLIWELKGSINNLPTKLIFFVYCYQIKGDEVLSVNETSFEGFTHQQALDTFKVKNKIEFKSFRGQNRQVLTLSLLEVTKTEFFQYHYIFKQKGDQTKKNFQLVDTV